MNYLLVINSYHQLLKWSQTQKCEWEFGTVSKFGSKNLSTVKVRFFAGKYATHCAFEFSLTKKNWVYK